MTQTELDRKAEIEAIELTEEEIKAAIQEGKIKKWWHQRNAPYWLGVETKPKTGKITFK